MAEKVRKVCKMLRFSCFSMKFHRFRKHPVGAPPEHMNIYTFWTDLDVSCPNFQKHFMVLGTPGAKWSKNHSPGRWAGPRWPNRARCKIRTEVRAGSCRFVTSAFLNGKFYTLVSYDEIEGEIMMNFRNSNL